MQSWIMEKLIEDKDKDEDKDNCNGTYNNLGYKNNIFIFLFYNINLIS